MKFTHVLPFVAASSAIVLPSEQVFQRIQEQQREDGRSEWYRSVVSTKGKLLSTAEGLYSSLHGKVEEGASEVEDVFYDLEEDTPECLRSILKGGFPSVGDVEAKMFEKVDDVKTWFHSSFGEVEDEKVADLVLGEDDFEGFGEDELEEMKTGLDDTIGDWFDETSGHHGGHHGHHPPHHGHPPHDPHKTENHTVYELIKHGKYSSVLADLISKYPDIVDRLNSTKHNVTVFAPTNKAFSKIPEKVLKNLTKAEVEGILDYHIVPGLYPASRVLFTQTAPTFLKSEHLSDRPEPQRITFSKGLTGIKVNFYSRVIAANIIGSNGVVHGVDTPIFPPIGAIKEIDLFPGAFSTFELALIKTGLHDKWDDTKQAGGTLFVPNNWAFEKLGPKINAFLFSPPGKKYLTALLKYHAVYDNTLYSDAYYHAGHHDDKDHEEKAKNLHLDLPTALKGHTLAVDISRWGPIVTIKINGFTRVAVPDVVADDGVIHVLTSVLIPPRKPRGVEDVMEGNLTVDDLVERLEPYVEEPVRKQDL